MDYKGFSGKGNWYKGNLHAHTTNSDGKKKPLDLVCDYQKQGYDFMALTDHDIFTDYSKELGSDNFLVIPGIEASAYLVNHKMIQDKSNSIDILWDEEGNPQCQKAHHFNAFLGTKEMQQKAKKLPFQHLQKIKPSVYLNDWDGKMVLEKCLTEFTERGFFVMYNHPLWSNVSAEDFIEANGLCALEVYNHLSEIVYGLGYDTTFLDMMLKKGKKVLLTATDDNHNKEGVEDSYGGYIMVQANELTHDAIVTNILKGNYYSSTGAVLYDWGIRHGEVYVECESVESIKFVVGNRVSDGAIINSEGNHLNKAVYQLKGHESYVRIECIRNDGKMAWTNPCYSCFLL